MKKLSVVLVAVLLLVIAISSFAESKPIEAGSSATITSGAYVYNLIHMNDSEVALLVKNTETLKEQDFFYHLHPKTLFWFFENIIVMKSYDNPEITAWDIDVEATSVRSMTDEDVFQDIFDAGSFPPGNNYYIAYTKGEKVILEVVYAEEPLLVNTVSLGKYKSVTMHQSKEYFYMLTSKNGLESWNPFGGKITSLAKLAGKTVPVEGKKYLGWLDSKGNAMYTLDGKTTLDFSAYPKGTKVSFYRDFMLITYEGLGPVKLTPETGELVALSTAEYTHLVESNTNNLLNTSAAE